MCARPVCVLAILASGLACGYDSTSPGGQAACTGNVSVAVSSGTTPSISWTPACKAFLVLVEDNGGDVWGVISDGTNAIPTPVQYGVVPPSATELTPPSALSPGTAYSVAVHRWTGPGAQDGALIGTKPFTP